MAMKRNDQKTNTIVGLMVLLLVPALMYGWAWSSGMVGQKTEDPGVLVLDINKIADTFADNGHLPWDGDARLRSIDVKGLTLRMVVATLAPSSSMVDTTVCNYRALRNVINRGANVEIRWKPEDVGPLMAVTNTTNCAPE